MKKSKVTSAKMAKLASKVLKGYEPTRDEVEALAASVMSQRERELEAKKEVPAPAFDSTPFEVQVMPEVSVAPVYVSPEAMTPTQELLLDDPIVVIPAADEYEIVEVAPPKTAYFGVLTQFFTRRK